MGMNNGSASTSQRAFKDTLTNLAELTNAGTVAGWYGIARTAIDGADRRLSREDVEAIADAVVARLDSPLRVTRAEMVALQRRGPIKAGG